MLPERTLTTLQEFERFIDQPENVEKLFEFIAGEIVEVPSNAFASSISANLMIELGIYRKQHGGYHITGEAGGYAVNGERYAPDVALLSKARQAELDKGGYNPTPPDLAIEVEFPTSVQSERRLRIKLANYLAAGTVVWVIYPETHEVEVYEPGQPPRVLGHTAILTSETLLPGFALSVKAIFTE